MLKLGGTVRELLSKSKVRFSFAGKRREEKDGGLCNEAFQFSS